VGNLFEGGNEVVFGYQTPLQQQLTEQRSLTLLFLDDTLDILVGDVPTFPKKIPKSLFSHERVLI
jgi:hypothetical protein